MRSPPHNMIRATTLATTFFSLVLTGCQIGAVNLPNPSSGATISYARDVQPIFNAHCTSCHGSGSPTSALLGIRMVLTSGRSPASLVNEPSAQRPDLTLVTPGDPNGSLLWLKVSTDAPPVGSRMPLLGSSLSSTDLATIRDWIAQGAADN